MLILAALAITLNVVTVRHVSGVSPIDEQYYIDHLLKASRLELDQSGDRLGDDTFRELCARKAEFAHYYCVHGTIDPKKFTPNYVRTQPVYFFSTGLTARALRAISPISLPPNDSLVTWARLLGAAWLLLGFYFTLRIGELFSLDRWLIVAGLVLVSGTPALLHGTTIVNPDAASFAAGAAVILTLLLWEQRRVGIWLPVLAALLAAGTKLPNTAVIGVALVYFVGRAVLGMLGHGDSDSRPWREYAVLGGSMVVAGFLAIRGWSYLVDFLRDHVIGQPDVDFSKHPEAIKAITKAYSTKGHGVSVPYLISDQVMPRLFPPVEDLSPPSGRADGFFQTVAIIDKYVLVAPFLALIFGLRRFKDRLTTLALATFIAALTVPMLFVVYWNVVEGTGDAIYPRYGLSLLPVFVLLLAAMARRGSVGRPALYLLAGVTWMTAVLTNFTSWV